MWTPPRQMWNCVAVPFGKINSLIIIFSEAPVLFGVFVLIIVFFIWADYNDNACGHQEGVQWVEL